MSSWHERFMVSTPRELVLLLFPFLPNLQMAITELGKKASLSMRASPRLLECVAKIVIQDAVAGMCDKYPEHDVHRLLLTSAVFRLGYLDFCHGLDSLEMTSLRHTKVSALYMSTHLSIMASHCIEHALQS